MTKRKLDAVLRNGKQLKQVRLDLELKRTLGEEIKKVLEDAGFENVQVTEREQ